MSGPGERRALPKPPAYRGTPSLGLGPYLQRLLLTLGTLATLALLWIERDIVLLVFAGLLLAVLLHTLSLLVARALPIGRRLTFPLALALLTALVALVVVLLTPRFATEIDVVRSGLPIAAKNLQDQLERYAWGRELITGLPDVRPQNLLDSSVLKRLSEAFTVTLGVLVDAVVVLFVALFVAASPETYREGALRLLPPASRPRAREVMLELVVTLRWWLVGQLFAMLTMGLLIYAGLSLLGMPFALVVGVLAGLLEFVPFIGALVGGLIAVTLALAESGTQALYVLLFYVVVQQIESNVLMPIVQRYTIELAPALTLVTVLVIGSLFGVLGLLVATPLVAIGVVLVRMLYVEDTLGEPAPPPKPRLVQEPVEDEPSERGPVSEGPTDAGAAEEEVLGKAPADVRAPEEEASNGEPADARPAGTRSTTTGAATS